MSETGMTREKALKVLDRMPICCECNSSNMPYTCFECENAFLIAFEALKQPEIIRCKDCKHYKDGFCYNPNTYDDEKTRGNTVPDWFCADGEQKG